VRKRLAFRAAASLFTVWAFISFGALWVQAAERYHGNVTSRIYHNARCKYFNCKKCTVVFKSAQEAQQAGYRPCKVCKG